MKTRHGAGIQLRSALWPLGIRFLNSRLGAAGLGNWEPGTELGNGSWDAGDKIGADKLIVLVVHGPRTTGSQHCAGLGLLQRVSLRAKGELTPNSRRRLPACPEMLSRGILSSCLPALKLDLFRCPSDCSLFQHAALAHPLPLPLAPICGLTGGQRPVPST